MAQVITANRQPDTLRTVNITRDEARRIADLAHLEFDDASLDRLAGEMTKILGYIDQLRDVDVEGIDMTSSASSTPFREDEVRSSLDRSAIENNAPSFENGFFVVPKVIE